MSFMSIDFRGISSQPTASPAPVFHGSIDNSSAPLQWRQFSACSGFTRHRNNGEYDQYFCENHHEAIISHEIFEKAIKGVQTSSWKCATRVEKGPTACEAPLVPERELQNAVLRGINMVLSGRNNMMTKLKENIEQVLMEEDTETIGTIDARLEELQQELIKRAGAKQDYEDLAEEIDKLREQRLNAMTEKAEREGLKMRIEEMQEFLDSQTDRISEYDEQLVRKMIEKITIYDDKFVIEFKSGTSLDVRR